MRTKYFYAAAMAAMLASCTSDVFNETQGAQSHEPAIAGETPVGFGVYTSRNLTRSGVPGPLTNDSLKGANGPAGATYPHAAAGFGVFAYYTDNQDYSIQSKPNFMYNQQVKTADQGSTWTYEPVKYWPNEYGDNAQSDDEDRVSFFAYAPYVEAADASQGTVADNTYGITGFSKNNAAGDPFVKYIGSFDMTKQVDLCYGTVDNSMADWSTINGGSQKLTTGLPYLDLKHPALIDQKMKFNFKHALAKLNVQIDVDVDDIYHNETNKLGRKTDGTEENEGNGSYTKVYVRSISFKGFTQKGALNLNNEEANIARWMNYNGTGALTLQACDAVTVTDGRRDGREGSAAATNEKNAFLNPAIIQSETATTGVIETKQNLFKPDASVCADAANPTDAEKALMLEQSIMVIPVDQYEPLTVTIVYDVETADPKLAGYLSDGTTHGSSVQNVITKEILFSNQYGLRSGYKHTVNLHLGMNSVKFDATVTDTWGPASDDVWMPENQSTTSGVFNSLNPLTITKLNNTDPKLSGAAATNAQILGLKTGTPAADNIMKVKADGDADWMIENGQVAMIKAGSTRSVADATNAGYTTAVNSATKVDIMPIGAGTTTLHCTRDGNESTIIIEVVAPKMTLDKSSVTLYKFSSDSPTQTVTATFDMPSILTTTDAVATCESTSAGTSSKYVASVSGDVITVSLKDGLSSLPAEETFTVKSSSGIEKTFTVKAATPTITVSPAAISMLKGKTAEVKVTTVPADLEAYGLTLAQPTIASGAKFSYADGVITADGDFDADQDAKDITFKFEGHDDITASCSVTLIATDITKMKADAQSSNPLLKVAQYNVAANGTSFVTSHSTANQYVFTWADANNSAKINITGYHMPTYDEQVKIIPSTNASGNGANMFAAFNTTPYAYGTDPSAACGKGFFVKGSGNNDVYGVRLFGDVLTAWHYKWAASPCNGLQIDSYVLSVAEGTTVDDDYMKKVVQLLPSSEVWGTADANDKPDASSTTSSLVSRFLPACGHNGNNSLSGVATAYKGSRGYYWSATQVGSTTKAFHWYFGSGYMYEYALEQGYGFSVRLFRD